MREKKLGSASFRERLTEKLKEGVFVASMAGALVLLMGLFFYTQLNTTLNSTNSVGSFFSFLSRKLVYFFGVSAYLFPLLIPYLTWQYLKSQERQWGSQDSEEVVFKVFGLILTLSAVCGLSALEFSGGGIVGAAAALLADTALSYKGAVVLLFGLLLTGVTFLMNLSWISLSSVVGDFALRGFVFCLEFLQGKREDKLIKLQQKRHQELNEIPKKTIKSPKISLIDEEEADTAFLGTKREPFIAVESPIISPPSTATTVPPVLPSSAVSSPRPGLIRHKQDNPINTGLPSLELLDLPTVVSEKQYSLQALEQMSRDVEERLKDFGVSVHVVAAHPGPVVTRFEMQLAPGIKVSKITALAKDLARSLSVISVRVVEVIPGKSLVGLELPNQHREIVRLSEVLSSVQYQEARSPLSLALGKDIAGHPVIVDLAKMPHLLVAGTTGAGKSVGLNAMLLSLLFKSTPQEVQMIMIDPKMLELSIYQDIPHLLTPVVTDMKEAANALRWCVAEMERRYRLMSAMGVRNLAGCNQKILQAQEKNSPILDPLWKNQGNPEETAPELQPLPYIVVVVDEFADMIMVVGKKVEELIARIAQKARAAGIHLILATQRPSVDVITGLIKANIPTRIAFQVSSKIDSRTILDQQGAEQLLGHGDMLYLAPGTGVPIRVHGAFVADHEVHQVVQDWKGRGEPVYMENILEDLSPNQNHYNNFLSGLEGESDNNSSDPESDELYDEAVKIVLETRRASISSVQRRLRIGYNRAARLLEAMETAGLVSGMETNGSREVLVPETQD